jgi:dTDP-glucose pyrophosphorylase
MICLIPAAGSGVRFKELGRQYPKAILPYKGRPILVRNIEELRKIASIEEVVITVGHQANKIRDCLRTFLPDEVESGWIKFVEYSQINSLNGPGVSIACALREATSQPNDVLVVLGDLLVEGDLVPNDRGSFVAAQEVLEWQRWCMVRGESGIGLELFDKPSARPPTNLALSGVYRFNDGLEFSRLIEESLTAGPSSTGEVEISAFLGPYLRNVPTEIRMDLVIRDFGTLEEYLLNREVASSRDFNELSLPSPGTVRKRALDPGSSSKIVEEISWYRTMPSSLSTMFPRVLDSVVGSDQIGRSPEYTMERVFLPTLRELYLFLESDRNYWLDVFWVLRRSLEEFVSASGDLGTRFWSTLVSRTISRHAQLPSRFRISGLIDELSNVIDRVKSIPPDSLFHGDMTLSNIFLDGARSRIVLIDPMGPPVGNILYDAVFCL